MWCMGRLGCNLNRKTIATLINKTFIYRFNKCIQLSTNLEARKGQADFALLLEKAKRFCNLFPDLTTEEEIIKILCILDTNTFQVNCLEYLL